MSKVVGLALVIVGAATYTPSISQLGYQVIINDNVQPHQARKRRVRLRKSAQQRRGPAW